MRPNTESVVFPSVYPVPGTNLAFSNSLLNTRYICYFVACFLHLQNAIFYQVVKYYSKHLFKVTLHRYMKCHRIYLTKPLNFFSSFHSYT